MGTRFLPVCGARTKETLCGYKQLFGACPEAQKLFDDMASDNPERRPAMAEVMHRFKSLSESLSEDQISRRVVFHSSDYTPDHKKRGRMEYFDVTSFLKQPTTDSDGWLVSKSADDYTYSMEVDSPSE